MRPMIVLALLLPLALQIALAPAVLHDALDGRAQAGYRPVVPLQMPCDGPATSKRLTDAPRVPVQPGDWKHLDDALAGTPPQGHDHGSPSPRIHAGAGADGASAHTGPRTPRAPPSAPLS